MFCEIGKWEKYPDNRVTRIFIKQYFFKKKK
ncbi:hypothetical protein T06_1593 [Trichinella sp. T6]|nr:hypothetical protein T06_1593 [Trichinella sp. T6]